MVNQPLRLSDCHHSNASPAKATTSGQKIRGLSHQPAFCRKITSPNPPMARDKAPAMSLLRERRPGVRIPRLVAESTPGLAGDFLRGSGKKHPQAGVDEHPEAAQERKHQEGEPYVHRGQPEMRSQASCHATEELVVRRTVGASRCGERLCHCFHDGPRTRSFHPRPPRFDAEMTSGSDRANRGDPRWCQPVDVPHSGAMSDTQTSGPRLTADQMRDVSRLRRPTDDRMVAGVAAGFARQLDIDPTIVRVLFGALTIFGGAGLILYGVAWLTIPEERRRDSAVSDLLRRDAESVMVVGLILAGVIAGSTMLGTIAFSAPNPWPVMVLVGIAVIVFVIFSRRQDPRPLPPPLPPQSSGGKGSTPPASPTVTGPWRSTATAEPAAEPMDAPAAERRPGDDDMTSASTSGAPSAPYGAATDANTSAGGSAPYGAATGAGTSEGGSAAYGGVSPHEPAGPDGPSAILPSGPPPPPFPPPPRRPRSRLLPITLCLILLAEGLIWIIDETDSADVAPSVYPGTALGIIAAALIVGAWYGRARLLDPVRRHRLRPHGRGQCRRSGTIRPPRLHPAYCGSRRRSVRARGG